MLSPIPLTAAEKLARALMNDKSRSGPTRHARARPARAWRSTSFERLVTMIFHSKIEG